MVIWQLLLQFIFRLTFGVALAMAITPSRLVTSGFYRVHLWVLLGLNTFACMILLMHGESLGTVLDEAPRLLPLAVVLAATCYVGSVVWMYEQRSLGAIMLYAVAAGGLVGACLATPWGDAMTGLGIVMALLDLVSSGVLLGVTLAAMLLGHWYLNTPSMQLLPLQRLVLLIAAAVLARTVVSGAGLVLQASSPEPLSGAIWVFVLFRWLSGLLGAFMLALLAWQTLKVPNTQSATGILYAGVTLTFLGELTSQLLSVDTLYPL